MNKTGSPRK